MASVVMDNGSYLVRLSGAPVAAEFSETVLIVLLFKWLIIFQVVLLLILQEVTVFISNKKQLFIHASYDV